MSLAATLSTAMTGLDDVGGGPPGDQQNADDSDRGDETNGGQRSHANAIGIHLSRGT